MDAFSFRKGISASPSKTKIFYFPHKAGIRSRYYIDVGSEAMARAAWTVTSTCSLLLFFFSMAWVSQSHMRAFVELFKNGYRL